VLGPERDAFGEHPAAALELAAGFRGSPVPVRVAVKATVLDP
jgi:hypothetical protein